jgi:hypothetical protein
MNTATMSTSTDDYTATLCQLRVPAFHFLEIVNGHALDLSPLSG